MNSNKYITERAIKEVLKEIDEEWIEEGNCYNEDCERSTNAGKELTIEWICEKLDITLD